jgi:ribosome-binding protein aMBF1 (putative translation factor)
MATRTIKAATKDAIEILHDRIRDDPQMQELLNEARLNAKIARLIYDARIHAGLTQAALAEKIGTKQPVIARLEDADYEGHSLKMLQRIAGALNLRLDVDLAPAQEHSPARGGAPRFGRVVRSGSR